MGKYYTKLNSFYLQGEKKYLGAKNTCIFCNKQYPDVSFIKIAHAIPEMLGNKAYFNQNECDICNEKFSKYESSFGELTHLFRAATGVVGKKGPIKLATDVFISYNSDVKSWALHSTPNEKRTRNIILYNDEKNKKFNISLDYSYNPMYINKMFAKMAISVLPNELQETYSMQFADLAEEETNIKANRLFTLILKQKCTTPNLSLFVKNNDIDNTYPKFLIQLQWEYYLFSYFLVGKKEIAPEISDELISILPRYLYSACQSENSCLELNKNKSIKKKQTIGMTYGTCEILIE